jgi:hypothetical protein
MAGNSTYTDGSGWNGGPKVPYHRDWIIGIMSSN